MSQTDDLKAAVEQVAASVTSLATAVTTETAAIIAALNGSDVATSTAVADAITSLKALNDNVNNIAGAVAAETAALAPPPTLPADPGTGDTAAAGN